MQVGIIMYLPTSDARQRKEITEEFFNYRSLAQSLWDDYSAYGPKLRYQRPIADFNLCRHHFSSSEFVEHMIVNNINLVNFKRMTSSLARIPGLAIYLQQISCMVTILSPFLPRFQRTRTS